MGLFFPRCIVRLTTLFDDAVGATIAPVWTAVPVNVSIERNNARVADKARIEIHYRDYPLDARMVSAIHVQVYMGDVGRASAQLELTPRNLVFQGYVDTPETVLGEDEGFVTLECRDYTALYAGRSWRRVADEERVFTSKGKATRQTRLSLPRGITLGTFIEQIRERIRPPEAADIESPPTVFDTPEVATRPLNKIAAKNYLIMRNEDTAWDVLTMVCEWYGQLPVWDLDEDLGPVLRIRTPAARGAAVAELDYGRDISKLMLNRNLLAPERRAIRLLAWNPRTKENLEAVFPPPGQASGETLGENGTPVSGDVVYEDKRVQYIVEGDYDIQLLEDIAKILYAEQAQGRIVGEVETFEMQDVRGTNLVRLANGDRLITRIGPNTLQGIESMRLGEAVNYLSDPDRANSLPRDVAQPLVEAYRAVKELQTEFFITDVELTWDALEGYQMLIRFSDFLLDEVEAA